MKSKIKWLVLLIIVIVILPAILFEFYGQTGEDFTGYLAECMVWISIGTLAVLLWTFTFLTTVLLELIFVQGYWTFLFIMLFCFMVAFLLSWKLPKSSRPLARVWPLICFMMGMAYKDALYVHQGSSSYIWWGSYLADAFAICLIPALIGLLVGNLLRR